MELIPRALRTNVLVLAFANAAAAVVLGFAEPGTSPSLQFLRLLLPLPIWAVGFAAAAVLLLARKHLAGHSVAVPLWAMLAGGALLGLVSGATRSPAGSALLAGLVVTVAGFHVNGMWLRRREAMARPRGAHAK